jgi:hypothetical protein
MGDFSNKSAPPFYEVGPWSAKMKVRTSQPLSFLPIFWPQTGMPARFYDVRFLKRLKTIDKSQKTASFASCHHEFEMRLAKLLSNVNGRR